MRFKKQFSIPKGFLGRIAGAVMALENRRLNNWTLSNLQMEDGHHILEIGYGPGVCIGSILKRYPAVTIDGIDVSKTMKKQAIKRLGEYIGKDKVKLMVGDVEEKNLGFNKYDRVITVNNYTIWTNPRNGLGCIYSSLKVGGRIAITMQPREKNASTIKTRMFANQIYNDLIDCGFSNIDVSFNQIHPILAVCVTAQKS